MEGEEQTWGGGINERRVGVWSGVFISKIMRLRFRGAADTETSEALNRRHGNKNNLLHGERETGAGRVPAGLPGPGRER